MEKIRDILNLFKQEIQKALGTDELVDFQVILPHNKNHGHIATNAALKLSKILKKNPQDIGQDIIENIDTKRLYIDQLQIVNPGFVNFFLKDEWIGIIGDMVLKNGLTILDQNIEDISECIKQDENFCKNTIAKLDCSSMNVSSNPFFYITYVHDRAKNVTMILEKEGYTLGEEEVFKFVDEHGRNLMLKILELDNVACETLKYKEPSKLYNYTKEYADLFHSYNNSLLIRQKSKEETLAILYVFKVIERFTSEFFELLDILGD